jgi:hypothetical protein
MKTPLKVGLVLVLSAVVILGGALFIRGPLLVEEKGSAPTTAGSAQPAATAAGANENGGFAGLAARTVKKGGSGAKGEGAEIALAEVEGSRAREDYINATFRPLAGLGVDVAMARVRELPDEASRDMAMLALLGEWSGQSVTELVQAGEVGRFGVAGALGLYLMNEGTMTPVQTAALANEFLTGQQRGSVLSRAAEKQSV